MKIASQNGKSERRIGNFVVERDERQLVLVFREAGSVPAQGCLFLGSAMGVILILGVLAVVAQTNGNRGADASTFVAPSRNHFGFLWAFCSIGMFVATPLFLRMIYKGPVSFTFRESDRAVLQDYRVVTRFEKIECVRIAEVRDPDNRFLYEVLLIHSDGQRLLLHNGYDERQAMNLANEISTYVHKPVQWRT